MAEKRETPTIIEISKLIENKVDNIAHLRTIGLLLNSRKCQNCHIDMVTVRKPKNVCSDEEMWQCSRCSTNASIRRDSVFEVCMYLIILLLYIYRKTPVTWTSVVPQSSVHVSGTSPNDPCRWMLELKEFEALIPPPGPPFYVYSVSIFIHVLVLLILFIFVKHFLNLNFYLKGK